MAATQSTTVLGITSPVYFDPPIVSSCAGTGAIRAQALALPHPLPIARGGKGEDIAYRLFADGALTPPSIEDQGHIFFGFTPILKVLASAFVYS